MLDPLSQRRVSGVSCVLLVSSLPVTSSFAVPGWSASSAWRVSSKGCQCDERIPAEAEKLHRRVTATSGSRQLNIRKALFCDGVRKSR